MGRVVGESKYIKKDGGYECPHCVKVIGIGAANPMHQICVHATQNCRKRPNMTTKQHRYVHKRTKSDDSEASNSEVGGNNPEESKKRKIHVEGLKDEIHLLKKQLRDLTLEPKQCPQENKCKYENACAGGDFKLDAEPTIDIREITFFPTMEEMAKGPKWYLHHVLRKKYKVHLRSSIVLVQPPPEWLAMWKSRTFEAVKDIIIKKPKFQRFERKTNREDCYSKAPVYQIFTSDRPQMTLEEYKLETETLYPSFADDCDAESIHWNPKRMESQNVTYATDVDQTRTLFTDLCPSWNLSKLKSNLDHAVTFNKKIPVKGMNEVYAYFGGRETGFPIHTENGDTYSINFLHWGAPKDWYGHSPAHYRRLIDSLKKVFVEEFKACPTYWRHKNAYPDPRFFQENDIDFCHIVQQPGQFVIAFKRGFHFGYNRGFNCAEAINFGTKDWIELGESVEYCKNRCFYSKQDCYIYMKEMRQEIDKCPRCSQEDGLTESENKGTCNAYANPSRNIKKERQDQLDKMNSALQIKRKLNAAKLSKQRAKRARERNLRDRLNDGILLNIN